MRIAFAGTPEFAARCLAALISAGHEIALVMAQPDRAAGRGMGLPAGPVKRLAQERGLRIYQPETLRPPESHEPLRQANVECLVVAAYGLILPPAILALPRFGCINIHASLLPRWRGAAPAARAILAGDIETGVCIMQMDAGLDTGPVLLSERMPITADDTAATLESRLASVGASLIVTALDHLPSGNLTPVAQATQGVTYAAKLRKDEASIDWTRPAEEIARQVRAFDPFPIAQTAWRGGVLRVIRANAVPLTPVVRPGVVVRARGDSLLVACGSCAIAIKELQKPGGKRLLTGQFLAGNRIDEGDVLDFPDIRG